MPEASNDFVIQSDNDNSGVGDIVFRTGTNERGRILATGGGTGVVTGPTNDQILYNALNLKSATFDPRHIRSGLALASQTARSGIMGLKVGAVVTNLVIDVFVAAAGTNPTNLWLALFTAAAPSGPAAQVAITADLAADAKWTSTGMKTFALTAPYVVPADGAFYGLVLMNGTYGTTQPQVGIALGSGVIQTAITGGVPLGLAPTGQATVPATIAFSNNDGQTVWVGVN